MKFFKRIINGFFNKTFTFWQFLGFQITPVHFYSPIPDVSKLPESLWQTKTSVLGMDFQEAKQIEWLKMVASCYQNEYEALKKYPDNTEFGAVDSEVLYSMVRWLKPKKMIEIGSGYSTIIAAQAIVRNEMENEIICQYTVIDPYPKKFVSDGFLGLSSLIKKPVQEIALADFEALNAGDILFIDSSHVLKIDSDVQYEFLDILPRLKPGVIIHVHDIFLPAEYPKSWILKEHRFFNEQYILQALLMFNLQFEVLWGSSFMHIKHSDLLKKYIGAYRASDWPGSFWMKKSNLP